MLAFPSAGLVPSGTPNTNLSSNPPPGVGAYMIKDVSPNRSFTLVKNPHFAGLGIPGIPKGHLDTIKVTITSNTQSEAEQVLQDQADAFDPGDTLPASLLPQIESKASGRFSRETIPSTFYFFLNTRMAPFNNPKAREAVNYAIDRRAFVRLASGFLKPVGPFDSPCAAVQIPIMNRAAAGPLAQISGSATSVGLTHGGPGAAPGEPQRYYPTGVQSFARVVAADDVQGPAGALMAKRLGVKRLFVLDDAEPYGEAIAAKVRETTTKIGLEIAGAATWDYRDRSFARPAKRIARSGADGVFLGGIQTASGPRLLRDLRAVLGRDAKLLAPDGFSDFKALVADTGPAAEGLVVSLPGVAAKELPDSGRRYVEEFEEAVGADALPYSITYAQATEVLLKAIAASDGTRASVARHLFRTRIENGILGTFELNANGDTTAGAVTMYRIEGGEERPVTTITPPQSLVR